MGALAAVVGVVLLVAAPAVAAPAWLAPADVFGAAQGDPGFGQSQPRVAMAPLGDAIAVWTDAEGADRRVQAAVRPAGGAWQAPMPLSTVGAVAGPPVIAVDGDGDAIVAWVVARAGGAAVQATFRSQDGAWRAPVDVAVASASLPTDLRLAFDASDAAILQWATDLPGGGNSVHAAVRPVEGTWRELADVSAPDVHAALTEAAFDASGAAVVAWVSDNGAHRATVRAARRSAAGAWEPTADLSATFLRVDGPRVVVDGRGAITVAWSGDDGQGYVAQATTRATGGAWGAATDLSGSYYAVSAPVLAVDAHGNVLAVWSRWDRRTFTSADLLVQAAFHPVGGGWEERQDLSPAGEPAGVPQLAMDADGDAVATWDASPGSGSLVRAARRPFGRSGWQESVVLSAPGQQASRPSAAVDGAGNAVAVFKRWREGGGYVVQAAGMDAGGPREDAVSIPATATAGEPVAFSVRPVDVWSAVGPTSWTFGDLGSAPGTAVVHTYAAPGNYYVTVTSADALGNATSATQRVAVLPPGGVALRPITGTSHGPRPALTGVRVTHRRFRVGTPTARQRPVRGKAPRGTTFLFALSARATLTVSLRRTVVGLRRGAACVTPSRRLRRLHAARCTRTFDVGTVTRPGLAMGAHGVGFSGRLGRRALRPGAYTATLTASNAGGRSKAVRLKLSVSR